MAESSGSVVSNNVNIQKQSSAVQSTDSANEDETDKVMEPMLLEDIKYKEEPRSLLNLLEYFERIKLTPDKNDILVGLIYILMLEYGFVPAEHCDDYDDYHFDYSRVLRFSKQLPARWKEGNMYTFWFVLPPFSLYKCRMACVPVADDILVNCVVKGVENGHYNTILDPLIYFISSRTDIKGKLQNMKGLSRLVKSEICFPVKQTILRNNSIINSCLEELPPEIMLLVMSQLKINDLVHLGQTNRFFYDVMRTPKLWIDRLRIDFKKTCAVRKYEKLRDYYKHNMAVKRLRGSRILNLYEVF